MITTKRVLHTPTMRMGTVMIAEPARTFVQFDKMQNPFTWAVNDELREITPHMQKLVDHRIACLEAWYPYCDAMYSDVADYERQTGEKF